DCLILLEPTIAYVTVFYLSHGDLSVLYVFLLRFVFLVDTHIGEYAAKPGGPAELLPLLDCLGTNILK
ncbi:unnamed protein product, partial [Symbiodinium necroappetens]